jgi:hypothetical protein
MIFKHVPSSPPSTEFVQATCMSHMGHYKNLLVGSLVSVCPLTSFNSNYCSLDPYPALVSLTEKGQTITQHLPPSGSDVCLPNKIQVFALFPTLNQVT